MQQHSNSNIKTCSNINAYKMDKSDTVDSTSLTSLQNLSCYEPQLNSSFRLQCSLSSLSSESDLSVAFERDLTEPTDCDGLPVFEIRAYSPHGRTPSPIDNDMSEAVDVLTPKQPLPLQQQRSPGRQSNPEYVALHEINAQISPPSDKTDDSMTGFNRSNSSLETIFEGVFLHTPPREKLNNSGSSVGSAGSRATPRRSRANLLELVAMNRMNSGKENQSPVARPTSPGKRNAANEFT